MRTKDLLRIAPYVGRMTPELLSVECWGGATYDVALRFIAEDPWERLAALRYNMPGLCLQMLLAWPEHGRLYAIPDESHHLIRGRSCRGRHRYLRIFDALNDVEQMRPAIEAVRETGSAIAEVALCYTGDLNSPAEDLYTLDYYLHLAEKIVNAGARMSSGSRTWPACCARQPPEARRRTAEELRPPGSPPHPRHRRWPACDVAGRHRGGS